MKRRWKSSWPRARPRMTMSGNPEAPYGFMRFRAEVGRTSVVGFEHVNPQLQERVIPLDGGERSRWDDDEDDGDDDRRGCPSQGTGAPDGADNRSWRPWSK